MIIPTIPKREATSEKISPNNPPPIPPNCIPPPLWPVRSSKLLLSPPPNRMTALLVSLAHSMREKW